MANSTTHLDLLTQGQSAKETTANAVFNAASPATLYAMRLSATSGLTWGYYGGNVTLASGSMSQIANGTLALTASATNYIVAAKNDGAVSVGTAATNWNNTTDYWRLYAVVAGASTVTSYTDYRQLGQLTGAPSFGSMIYQGSWNAATNSPTLASGTGTKGYYYVVSTAGTTSIDGIALWSAGDMIVFNGAAWEKIDASLSAQEMGNLINSATEKTTPADADMLGLMDSADGNILKKLSIANLKALIWTAWGALINAGTSKTTPADADALALMDSAAGNATKQLTWANLKAALKTYFDTLYQALSTYLTNAVGAAAAGFGIITDDKLGALAYASHTLAPLAIGPGLAGTGTICKAHCTVEDGLKVARVLIDLTGLNSGGTAGDIIGVNGTSSACYLIRIPTMTVLGGRMTCLETPAGGDTDIDLYAATEGTGVEDGAISALTETQIINAGAQTAGTLTYFAADPAANDYLYLVGQGTANATYTAGRLLIEIFGA